MSLNRNVPIHEATANISSLSMAIGNMEWDLPRELVAYPVQRLACCSAHGWRGSGMEAEGFAEERTDD